ncbi:MAG: hypothetical protein HYS86_04125 [Candidatus Chisholmbacteria bacterium]|nr:hypothetical protein [Candidatus Chisholmbacteria bacterium]
MSAFLDTTLFRNVLGLGVIAGIWLIFSLVGLRGVSLGKPIKDIRQEAGMSLLTLAVFTLGLLGLIALIYSN